MAKKNSGGLFGALTMKQTDGLAVRLLGAQKRLCDETQDYDTAHEIYEVVSDLHKSWMSRADAGERAETSKRARRR